LVLERVDDPVGVGAQRRLESLEQTHRLLLLRVRWKLEIPRTGSVAEARVDVLVGALVAFVVAARLGGLGGYRACRRGRALRFSRPLRVVREGADPFEDARAAELLRELASRRHSAHDRVDLGFAAAGDRVAELL